MSRTRVLELGLAKKQLFTVQEWEALAERLHLSERELQIMQCIVDDLKEAGIARVLGISSHTVRTHIERLYRKLAVSSRSSLLVHVFAEYLFYHRASKPLEG